MRKIPPSQVRDQTVLRDYLEWAETQSPASALIEGLCGQEDYSTVWEHFALSLFGHNAQLILLLAGQVMTRLRAQLGAQASGKDPHHAFLALWRCAIKIVRPSDDSYAWLADQIEKSMPVSLALVNDLYYYWATPPPNGIVSAEHRVRLRRIICDLARSNLKAGDHLVRIVHPDLPYSVYHFVFPPDPGVGPSENRGPEHWNTLGPILLDALRTAPESMATQIVHLVSTRSRHDEEQGIPIYEADRSLLYGFFGDSVPELIRLIAQVRDRATADDRAFSRSNCQIGWPVDGSSRKSNASRLNGGSLGAKALCVPSSRRRHRRHPRSD